MFTVEKRNQIRDQLLNMGKADSQLVAGALVGGSAVGEDRWSDLDITFGIAEEAAISDVLSDWTSRLQTDFRAVHLFDLPHQSTCTESSCFRGTCRSTCPS